MRYHLCKQSRVYNGEPYCGPTSYGIPAESDSLEDAFIMAGAFLMRNPVGWDVYDSHSGEIVTSQKVTVSK